MALLVPVLVVAFLIWLAVRISNRHTKPARSFWIAAAVAALLSMYPLSFGQACRLAEHGCISLERVAMIYSPIVLLAEHGPEPFASLIRWSADQASGYSGKTGILTRLKWEPSLQSIDREQRRMCKAMRSNRRNISIANTGTTHESE